MTRNDILQAEDTLLSDVTIWEWKTNDEKAYVLHYVSGVLDTVHYLLNVIDKEEKEVKE